MFGATSLRMAKTQLMMATMIASVDESVVLLAIWSPEE